MDSTPPCSLHKSNSSTDTKWKNNLLDTSEGGWALPRSNSHPQPTDHLREWITPHSKQITTNKLKERNRQGPRLSEKNNDQFVFAESKSLVEPVTFRYIRENGNYRNFKEQKLVKHYRRSSSLQRHQRREREKFEPEVKSDTDVGKVKEEFENLMKTNSRYFKLVESHVLEDAAPESPSVQDSQIVINFIQPSHLSNGNNNSAHSENEKLTISASPLRAKTTLDNPSQKVSEEIRADDARAASIGTWSHSKPKSERIYKRQRQIDTKTYGQRLRQDQLMVPLGHDAFSVAKVSSKQTYNKNSDLKPIEKITPAMRENFDNLQARERLNQYEPQTDLGSAQWVDRNNENQSAQFNSTSISYRVNKLGEARHKAKESKPSAEHFQPTDFQAFLPSISGKGIGSVSSTR